MSSLLRRALRKPYRWATARVQATKLRGPRVMMSFARRYPRATFVQIGSNDGEKHDPLHQAILRSEWTGIMVEPVPYVFDRLRRNYGFFPRIVLENVAVAATQEPSALPFYYVREAKAGEKLPDWYDELGSFRRDVLLSHANQIAGLEGRIVEALVPCVTLPALCERHGLAKVDLLHTDAEGYDAELVGALDLERQRPILLIYEHKHLPAGPRAACRQLLEDAGYECFEEAADTWCIDTRERDHCHRLFLRDCHWINILRLPS